VPEPEPENEQATPEQITQLDDLQRQIDKLENMLSNPILFESKSAEEFTPEQISKVKKLEKEIKKLERVDTEYDIIQTLQKQNKKLDDIEKKLHDLEK
jgi:protein subunit release factor A